MRELAALISLSVDGHTSKFDEDADYFSTSQSQPTAVAVENSDDGVCDYTLYTDGQLDNSFSSEMTLMDTDNLVVDSVNTTTTSTSTERPNESIGTGAEPPIAVASTSASCTDIQLCASQNWKKYNRDMLRNTKHTALTVKRKETEPLGEEVLSKKSRLLVQCAPNKGVALEMTREMHGIAIEKAKYEAEKAKFDAEKAKCEAEKAKLDIQMAHEMHTIAIENAKLKKKILLLQLTRAREHNDRTMVNNDEERSASVSAREHNDENTVPITSATATKTITTATVRPLFWNYVPSPERTAEDYYEEYQEINEAELEDAEVDDRRDPDYEP